MPQEIRVHGLAKPLYFDDNATDEQIDHAIKTEILPQLPELQRQEQADAVKESQQKSFKTNSKLEQFLAGTGRGLMDVYEGAGQLGLEAGNAVGLVKPETLSGYNDRAEAERQVWDNSASGLPAGVGRFAGQFLPTMLLPGGPAGKGMVGAVRQGAIQGAEAGALQFTGEDDSRALNTIEGAGLGGAGGAASNVLGGLVPKIVNAVKGKMGASETAIDDLAKQFGVRATAGDVSNQPGFKRAEQGMEYLPGLGMTKYREQQANEVKAALSKVVDKYKGKIPEVDYKWLDNIKKDATRSVLDKSVEATHPVVAYHGTKGPDFGALDSGPNSAGPLSIDRKGTWLTSHPGDAEQFTNGPGGRIIPARLPKPDVVVDFNDVTDPTPKALVRAINKHPEANVIGIKDYDQRSDPGTIHYFVRDPSKIEPLYNQKTSEVIGSAKANKLLADIQKAGDNPDDIIKVSAAIKEYRAHQIAGQLYDNVEKLAGDAKVPTTNLKAALKSVGKADRDALLSEPDVAKMVKDIQKKVDPPYKVVNGVQQPTPVKEFDYGQMRRARSDLKDKISSLTRIGKFKEASALTQVKNGLESDIQAFTDTKPGQAYIAPTQGAPFGFNVNAYGLGKGAKATAASPGQPYIQGLKEAQQKADDFYRTKYGPIRDYSRKFFANKEADVLTQKGLNPKSADASHKFYSALDDKGRAAVRYNVVQDAWDKAFDDASQRINPSKFAAHLEKNQQATQFFFKGQDKQELEGLTKLLRHLDRAHDYASKPTATSRLGQLGVLGGVATGMAFNLPLAVKAYGGAYVLKQLMTSPAGKRILLAASSLSPKNTKALSMLTSKIPAILQVTVQDPKNEDPQSAAQ